MMTRLLMAALLLPSLVVAAPLESNVRDFGAVGDGRADDTAAIQRALDEAGKSGATVRLPPGRYVLRGTLNVPESVTLAGTFAAPARTHYTEEALEKEKGSILLAYAGKGEEDGAPLITLNRASHLRGVIVFYPEQVEEPEPIPFPWTVRGHGDNCSITATLLINPYRAVDFGTFPCGRHFIDGLYAQALKTGLFIDKCFDVGRVQNVHFWPFWRDSEKLQAFMKQNATAFIVGRTDWQYFSNCFTIWYGVGYHFIAGADGPGNAVLTNCGADIGPTAVKIDQVQPHAGVSFVNGQFMAGIDVSAENQGPVKFTACGFWGEGATDTHAHVRGGGHVTFTACHFAWWGQTRGDAPAIVAESGGVTLNGCEFRDRRADVKHVELREDVEAAAIFGNRFRAPPQIVNHAEGDVQIGLNVGGAPTKLKAAMAAGDADMIASLWSARLTRAPLETYSPRLRLDAAQALAGSGDALREKMLQSILRDGGADAAIVARARDELALDAGEQPDRPLLVAARQSKTTPSAQSFLQPGEKRAGAATTFSVAWDDERIYFHVRAAEPRMDRLRAEERTRDGRIWTDDSIEFFFCPRRVTHRYHQLIVNALGVHYEGTGDATGTTAAGWDVQPEITTRRDDDGWTIELRLTWQDLGVAAPAPGETWAIDVRRWRHVEGRADYASWSTAPAAPPTGATHRPETFGYVRFE